MRTPGDDEELAAGFLYGEGLIDGAPEVGLTEDLAANVDRGRRTAAARAAGDAALLHDLVVRRLRQGGARGGRGARARRCESGPADRARRCSRRCRTACASPHSTGPAGCTRPACSPPAGELAARARGRRAPQRDGQGDRPRAARRAAAAAATACCASAAACRSSSSRRPRVAGAPILVGVGAPTSLAVELAADRGLTLAGFARGGQRQRLHAPRARGVGLAPFVRIASDLRWPRQSGSATWAGAPSRQTCGRLGAAAAKGNCRTGPVPWADRALSRPQPSPIAPGRPSARRPHR